MSMTRTPTKKHNVGKPIIKALTQLRDGLKSGKIRVPTKPRKAVGVKAVKSYTSDAMLNEYRLPARQNKSIALVRFPNFGAGLPVTLIEGHIGKDFRIVPVRTARGRKK